MYLERFVCVSSPQMHIFFLPPGRLIADSEINCPMCGEQATFDNRRVKASSPIRYCLTMEGMMQQFALSNTTFPTFEEAMEAANKTTKLWGRMVSVEEVEE